MKSKKVIALALVLVFVTAFSIALPACSCSPDPSEPTVMMTAYGNETWSEVVRNPSDDVDITVVKKKTSTLRGHNVKWKGTGSVTTEALSAGDLVQIDADYCWIKVKICGLSETVVYSPSGQFTFEIPSDTSAYPTGAFSASGNTITAAVATAEEIAQIRNLAANPYDFMYARERNDQTAPSLPLESASVKKGEVTAYPHAYANRVTRNETGFFARNAIDGSVTSDGHGNYPYQSWGYDQKSDAEFVVYFGREVNLESLSFVLRADYSGSPEHDTYWSSVTAEFSDGSSQEISLSKSGERQEISVGGIDTTFVRLKNIRAAGTSDQFAALTELEATGADLATENAVATKTYVRTTFGGKDQRVQTTDEYSAEDIRADIEFINGWFLNEADGKLRMKTYNDADETIYVNSDDWRDSVYYMGMLDYFLTSGDMDAYYYLRGVSEQFDWLCNSDYRTPHGDHYVIGEMYLQLSDLFGDNYKIKSAVDNAIYNVERDPEDSSPVTTTNSNATDSSRDWSHMAFWWCDALYMAMNTYTLLSLQTGDDSYVKAAYDGYSHWRDILYNTKYHLWHRDTTQLNVYTTLTDEEGNRVPTFWARGNAWVLGALAKQLLYLDEEKYPEMYETYQTDFIEIATALKQYQREDGTWNASIVDGNYYGGREVTGTSGFIYGMATGIQLGILDYDEFFPTVQKAYDGMMEYCMLTDAQGEKTGQLGYMQTVGYQPQNYKSEEYSEKFTDEFGMGLFLLGASALMRLCDDYEQPAVVLPSDRQSTVRVVDDPFPSSDPAATDYITGITVRSAGGYQNDSAGVNPPAGLFDGDASGADGKRWAVDIGSGYANAWVEADLGRSYAIRQFVVAPNSGRDYRYKIEVSTNGSSWTTAVDRTQNTTGAARISDTVNVTARYVRITFTGAATYTGSWCNINELFVYGE